MQDFDNFIERLKKHVDKAVDDKVSQIVDTSNIEATRINGFRSLGANQFLKYRKNLQDVIEEAVGDPGVPTTTL